MTYNSTLKDSVWGELSSCTILSYDKIPIDEKYKVVFSTMEGQDVLRDILEFCGIGRLSYSQNNPDVNSVIFNEGKRSVGLQILSQINQEPINYVKDNDYEPTT